jgi:hypothetical protein
MSIFSYLPQRLGTTKALLRSSVRQLSYAKQQVSGEALPSAGY